MDEEGTSIVTGERIASYPRDHRRDMSGPGPRRKAVAASITGTLLPWGAFATFCRAPKSFLPGLQMDAKPFYRDQEFWEWDFGIMCVIGFPGLLIAATILAGRRWPAGFLRGLFIAPVQILLCVFFSVFLHYIGTKGFFPLACLLVFFGFSWIWAYGFAWALESMTDSQARRALG